MPWVTLDPPLLSWLSVRMSQRKVNLVVIKPGMIFGTSWFSSSSDKPSDCVYYKDLELGRPYSVNEWLRGWLDDDSVQYYTYLIVFYRSGRLRLDYYPQEATSFQSTWRAWRSAPPRKSTKRRRRISTYAR